MIGVFLRPDLTQVVKARRRKHTLHVAEAVSLPPYLQYLQLYDAGSLANLFIEIRQIFGSDEEYYVVLPNRAFDFIDCGDFSEVEAAPENWEKAHDEWLERRNIESSAYYTSYPIEFRTNLRHMKTSVSIAKNRAECLFSAAKAADISLVSVEAAGTAYLRCLGKWREEHCILECFDKVCLLAYSPLGGLFRLPLPQLANLTGAALEEAVDDAFAQYEIIAKKTFVHTNFHVSVHVLSSSADITELESIRRRLGEAEFPRALVKTDLAPEEELAYMVPIGTVMQVLEQESFFYEDLPVFLKLTTANILPNEVKLAGRFTRLKKKTKQYAKTLIGVLLVSLAVEAGGYWYFSSFQVPEELQKNYDEANASIVSIKRELEMIKLAGQEHQYPLEAITGLLAAKPKDVGFLNLELGRGGSGTKQWIVLNAAAPDPMRFREYADKLSANPIFSGIHIQQISTESRDGQKRAALEIQRGKI